MAKDFEVIRRRNYNVFQIHKTYIEHDEKQLFIRMHMGQNFERCTIGSRHGVKLKFQKRYKSHLFSLKVHICSFKRTQLYWDIPSKSIVIHYWSEPSSILCLHRWPSGHLRKPAIPVCWWLYTVCTNKICKRKGKCCSQSKQRSRENEGMGYQLEGYLWTHKM